MMPDLSELLQMTWEQKNMEAEAIKAQKKRRDAFILMMSSGLIATVCGMWFKSVPYLLWLLIPVAAAVNAWLAHDKAAELEDNLENLEDKIRVCSARAFADKEAEAKFLREHNLRYRGMRRAEDVEAWEEKH